MPTKQQLLGVLNDGKSSAIHADGIVSSLNMSYDRSNLEIRKLITECVVDDNWPIGSIPVSGYFLIDSQNELDEVVASLQSRIYEIQKRIDALTTGYSLRLNSRTAGGNWPK